MATDDDSPERYAEAIRRSGLTIYDHIDIGDPELWIPVPELEELLNVGLVGISLAGLPLRRERFEPRAFRRSAPRTRRRPSR